MANLPRRPRDSENARFLPPSRSGVEWLGTGEVGATVRPITPTLTVPLKLTINNRFVVYDGQVQQAAWNKAGGIIAIAKANPRDVADGFTAMLFLTGLVNRRFLIIDEDLKPITIKKGMRVKIISGSQSVDVPLNVLGYVAEALGFLLLEGYSVIPIAESEKF